jgi:hypothetical protein
MIDRPPATSVLRTCHTQETTAKECPDSDHSTRSLAPLVAALHAIAVRVTADQQRRSAGEDQEGAA